MLDEFVPQGLGTGVLEVDEGISQPAPTQTPIPAGSRQGASASSETGAAARDGQGLTIVGLGAGTTSGLGYTCAMGRASILTAVLVATLAGGAALANGRFPATRGSHRSLDGQNILIPSTFGLVLSTDGGSSYHWVCERALGYAGTYDPQYVLLANGEWWMTSFDGLRVSTDKGCTWVPYGPPFDGGFVGALAVDQGQRLWAAATSEDVVSWNGVYRRDADATVFQRMPLDVQSAWWSSVAIAPSDQQVVLVSGYVVKPTVDADGGATQAEPLMFRSRDGGDSWNAIGFSGINFGTRPDVKIDAISPTNSEVFFVRVQEALASGGDAVYRTADGGASFQQVLAFDDPITAFLYRKDGSAIIAGTTNAGVRISKDGGLSWQKPATEPKMGCIDESADGELYACGSNWEPDNFSLGRSQDAETWTKVFTFQDIGGPLICEPGTEQRDYCTIEVWPGLAQQLGLAGNQALDAGPGGGSGGGCGGCSMAFAGILLLWPRRRRNRAEWRREFL